MKCSINGIMNGEKVTFFGKAQKLFDENYKKLFYISLEALSN